MHFLELPLFLPASVSWDPSVGLADPNQPPSPETSPRPGPRHSPRTRSPLLPARSSPHRPHHRLRAAIERAVLRELHQFARDLRLGGKIHGGVGMLPIPLDAEPLEFFALYIEPVLSVGAALLAKLDHRLRIREVRLLLVLG